MRTNLRVLALCLFGGVLGSVGFIGTQAIADSFSDTAGSPFVDEIDWLTDYDIASGFPNGTFKPKDPINRQQAAFWFSNLNSELELVEETTNPTTAVVHGIVVNCPGDKRAIAGGGFQFSAAEELVMTDSYPSAVGHWSVRFIARDGSSSDPSEITGWALCAPRVLAP